MSRIASKLLFKYEMPHAVGQESEQSRRRRHFEILILPFSTLVDDLEIDFTALHFFERDARGFMFLGVNVYARARAALKLLASFCRHNNQTIFRIYHRQIILLRRGADCFARFCHHVLGRPPVSDAAIKINEFVALRVGNRSSASVSIKVFEQERDA